MLELYVFLTLASVGYLLTKNTSVPNDSKLLLHKNELPSMNNIYDSRYAAHTQHVEASKGRAAYAKSMDPSSKVVNNMYRESREKPDVVKSMLSGVEIPRDEFKHNNQVPYFGSKVRQNTSPNAHSQVMERFTGGFDEEIWKNKREAEPLFKPSVDVGYVNGAPQQLDTLLDRYEPGRIRNNERPFEPLNVGPGLDAGYNADGVGGFQQFDRDFILPRTVDELRVATKPKETYGGRTLPGAGIAQRGKTGEMNKNRADTFFVNTPDRYFTTVGAETRETARAEYEVKDTNRTETSTNSYVGSANAASKANKLDPQVRDSMRQQLNEFGFRNADLDNYGKGENYDFGKETFDLPPNERDATTERTYQGNVVRLVKERTAPLEDIFKNTRKEYTVQHPRQYGQLQPTFPDKITVKDPNDVARTTIKETNIHDTRLSGNFRANVKSVVYDPEDIARRTTRETAEEVDTALNVAGERKGKVYDPDMKTRTTAKETLIDEKRNGNIERLEGRVGAYDYIDVEAPTTQKEFLSNKDYIGGGGATAGLQDGGYQVANTIAPDTQKQFLSDKDHYGSAGSVEYKSPMSQQDAKNARINVLKEGTLLGREPTQESVKVAYGGEDINVKIRKIEDDYINKRAATSNNPDNIRNAVLSATAFTFTKERTVSEFDHADRLDANMISALDTNPFSIPPLHAS
jgi:hypothetical protein